MLVRDPLLKSAHLKNAPLNVWEGGFKLTFATLVIVAGLSYTFYSPRAFFSITELANVLTLGIVVSGVLLLGAQALALRSKTAANLALAGVTLACAFTSYIVHTELFFPANRAAMVLICGAALFGLFVGFRVIDEWRWGGIVLCGLALTLIVWPISPNLFKGLTTPGGILSLEDPRLWAALISMTGIGLVIAYAVFRYLNESHWGGVALLSVVAVGGAVVVWSFLHEGRSSDSADRAQHPEVQDVTFEEKPNVYFVGFDSVVPEAILQKNLGVESTNFHRLFRKEMRRFNNLFASSVGTKNSFSTLMALSQDIFLAEHKPDYFSGQSLSPLVSIMRENGYETTSIYNDFFFGHTKGPYIDNYLVNDETGAVCALMDEAVKKWALWGYCQITDASRSGTEITPAGDFLVRELTGVGQDRPQFVIAHIYMPGHTLKSFRYDDLRDRESFVDSYISRSNQAASYLGQIIEHVRNDDPTAILFVFGDHGMFLSTGMQVKENPTFVIQDRFAVLGGVFPYDRCGPYFDQAEAKRYMTTLDAVHAILGCLSGGQSALLAPRHDRFFGGGLEGEHDYRYEEYLYD